GLKAGDVNITSSGIDAGNTQISGVKAGEQDTDAANVAQLKAAAAASANKVAAGDNIEVAETKNTDGSTTYTVATAKEVSFNSVTAGTGANRVVLDDAGVSVGGNTYISGNGINANNQKVTNVASGNVAAGSTDAVNGGQLHNTAASVANVFGGNATVNPDGSVSMSNIGGTGANNVNDAIAAVNQAAVEAKTTVSAGDNIVVAQSTNADGSTNYTVSTAKDLAVDSVKAGDTVLNGNGLSIANGPSITAGGLDMGGKKITNVADGEISATSKDAINGSQLYQAYQVLGGNANAINTITAPATENADGTTTPAGTVVTVVTNPDGTKTTTTETNQTVAVSTDKGGNQYTLTTYNVEGQNTYVTNDVIQAVGKMNEQGIKFFHTNDGVVEPVAQGHNTEDSSASGAYATAIGYQSVASGEGAVAMGNTYTASTQVDGAQVTEVKDAGGNVTGYAQSTVASGTRAIAMGTGSQALAEDSIAIGTGNVVSGKNSGAIGDPTVVTGDSAYSIGNNNTVSADNAYALGSNIKATLANSVYLGDNASATAVHTTAGGGNYTFAGANDANVAGVEDVVGVVSVGTEGETRQIQNVAAGVVSATSTDAINGSQLHYTNEAINNVANYTVNMGNQLNQRIDDVENRSNAGAATAMAVAGLPQAYMPGKSMVAVAGGVYRGESGYAVGYSSISDNGNWVIKGSATGNSRGHYGATAGVGYQW
ncbi:YadA family autotransporter adhesin, partial [Neisseria dentiae]|uniref:YadA family autotransporter adhesin n=1 Tax=Neisseria dentiae TaxID=194197 RepID=UPI00211BFEB5